MRQYSGILLGLAGFLLAILILNFFNILPLSKNYPQFFGFLPATSQKMPVNQTPNQTLVSEEEIKVVCKRFTNFKEALDAIDIACVLDLSDQDLNSVPKDITKLTKLNELSLKGNKLTQFPTELLSMINLISLDLSDNQITEVPPDLNKLENLQSLDLSNNKISSLPKELGRILILKLTGNPIPDEEQKSIKELFPQAEITF